MKFIILPSYILTFLIFTVCLLISQESNSRKHSDSTNKNSLKSGMFAIQFAIGSDFTLTNFEGAVFSAKYHFSPKAAVRASFYGSYSELTSESIEYDFNGSYSIGGNLIFMYYINPKDVFNIYGYAGGQYLLAESTYENNSVYNNVTEWTIGPVLGAGAEYFIFKQFSAFAEYSFSFKFGQLISTNILYYPPNTNIEIIYDKTRFESNYVKFGVSVYF